MKNPQVWETALFHSFILRSGKNFKVHIFVTLDFTCSVVDPFLSSIRPSCISARQVEQWHSADPIHPSCPFSPPALHCGAGCALPHEHPPPASLHGAEFAVPQLVFRVLGMAMSCSICRVPQGHKLKNQRAADCPLHCQSWTLMR